MESLTSEWLQLAAVLSVRDSNDRFLEKDYKECLMLTAWA